MSHTSEITMVVLIAVFGLAFISWAVVEVTRTERMRRESFRHQRRRR